MRLTAAELELVRRNRPVYEAAARLTGLPWQMLATLHYLENSLRSASPGPGGPYQIDPPPDQARLERVLGRYQLPVKRVEDDFFSATVFAGHVLQSKVMGRLHPETMDEALIKDAFWGYNGRAYGSADDSPYVSNDPPARILRVRGSVIGRDGQRVFIDQPFRKHGAIFVYRELRELFPDAADPNAQVVDDGDPAWSAAFRDQTRALVPYRDERGRDFHYARTCAEGDTLWCDWQPRLDAPGRYLIEVFIPGVHATTRQALYFVRGVRVGGQPVEQMVVVDQLAASDEWLRLDEFELDPALPESGLVHLTNYTPETPEREIAFDSVRWRRLG